MFRQRVGASLEEVDTVSALSNKNLRTDGTTAPLSKIFPVDKRRAEGGLPPLSEYREMLKQFYFPQSQAKP